MIDHNYHTQRGNAVIIILVVLLIAAVGGMAYMSGIFADKDRKANAPQGTQMAKAQNAAEQAEQTTIEPGNPVVAKIGDKELTRMDVFNYIQTLPPENRQMPMDQLFPLVQNQVINTALVNEKSAGVNLDNDPLVKQQVELAKQQIIPVAFMQREVTKALSEDRVKKAYEQYKANFPEVNEVRARHILVKEEALAKDLIKQINEGGSFEELAKEHSTDPTGAKGGDLGFFSKTDVVKEFGDAAFSQELNTISAKPVKSEYGFHIIKSEDTRKRPPASYEEAKPFIEGQLRQVIAAEIMQNWREEKGVELFDINGNAIEPASGEAPAQAAE